jgi:hypothetical protein
MPLARRHVAQEPGLTQRLEYGHIVKDGVLAMGVAK